MQITGGFRISGGGINFNANDPNFNYVSLLTSTTGANAANANTFVTSSPNSFSFTRSGNVAQGSFSPYGQLWSNYFDGTGDYLKSASSSVFAFGANDFTMEAWVFPITVAGTQGVISTRTSLSGSNQSFFGIDAGTLLYYASSAIASTALISAGQWSHIAATRSGTTIRVFLNGVQVATGTDSSSKTTTFGYVAAGGGDNSQLFTGYVADARIVNGTALYTANFTPPMGPLTATANTALLTCQSNRFVDNSPNNLAITRNGDVRITKESPYEPITAQLYGLYETGWSNYFDGTGDYLTIPSNTAFDLNTGDYTVEFWFYVGSVSSVTYSLLGPWTFPNGWLFQQVNNAINFYGSGGNLSGFHTSGAILQANQWTHVACTRSGSTSRMFVNGTLVSTTSVSINASSTVLGIGVNPEGFAQQFNGYISNVRIVKGNALYTANFTPPNSPLTPIPGTTLLTCQNNRFIDLGPNNFTLTVNGNTTSSTLSPFTLNGAYRSILTGGSAYFSGTTDYLSANTTVYNVGSGNFTVECWAYPTTTQLHFFASGSSTNQWAFGLNASNQLIFRPTSGTTDEIIGTSTVPLNTWNHCAVVRESTAANQTKIYLNGQLEKTGNGGGIPGTAITLQVGTGRSAPSNLFAGYISDLRVSNVAVYTANFAVPSTPLSLVSTTNANTFALLSSTNAGIFDSAGKNNLITYGDTKVATNVTKFGYGSIQFDGTGDYLLLTGGANSLISQLGDFTCEAWLYPTASAEQTFFYFNGSTTTFAACRGTLLANGAVRLLVSTNNSGWDILSDSASSLVPNNQWTHVAIVRSGGTFYVFVAGTSAITSTTISSTTSLMSSSTNAIGALVASTVSQTFTGYIEDVRITKGIARYTANFAPPTQPFPRC